MKKHWLVLGSWAAFTLASARAATVTVVNNAPTGPGSLQAAINTVNSNLADRIEFHIGDESGLKTILVTNAVPQFWRVRGR